ncbi:MAG: hypothetical protein M1820_003634 [Bogoriella megaspora]|nr:MAG: hypothetical protein M1820_003634 [Bogoriella megaspora]
MATKTPTKGTLTIAALLVDPNQGVQILDLGGLNVLATMGWDYLAGMGLPAPVVEQALDATQEM